MSRAGLIATLGGAAMRAVAALLVGWTSSIAAADPQPKSPAIAAPDSAQWSPKPRVWRYESEGRKLAFIPTHNGWLEIARDTIFSFSQQPGEEGFVELSRENPRVRAKLFDDRCDISINGAPFFTIHRGAWSDKYPFPRAIRFAGEGEVSFPDIRGAFRKGQPFLAELWLRPNADPPAGTMTLVACGPSRVTWEVQPNRSHRIVVRTEGKPFMFVSFGKLMAEWSVLHFGHDGERVFLALNGHGMAHLVEEFLTEDAGTTPLTLGGARSNENGLWADVAAFRLSSRCRLSVAGPASQKSLPLRPPPEIPDAWTADTDTQVLMSLPSARGTRVSDRSGKNRQGQLSKATLIDVLTATPYLVPNSSAIAGTPRTGDASSPRPSPAPRVGRRPVPPAVDIAKALSEVQEIFKTNYAQAKKPAEKSALAARLAEYADKTRDDPTAQFVLLDEARRLSAEAGQMFDATARIDELSKSFEVDRQALQLAAVQQIHALLAASASAPQTLRLELIDGALAASLAALAAERFDMADSLAQLAVEHAATRQVAQPELQRRAALVAQITQRARSQWQSAHEAEQHLQAEPNDAGANFDAGRFHAFRRQQWATGLAMLAKAGEPPLTEAAELDRAAGDNPKDRLKAALAWEKAADSVPAEVRRDFLERAAQCFTLAMDAGLKGLDRELARQHLDALRSQVPPMRATFSQIMPSGAAIDVYAGFIGRVYVGGRDLGVTVTYQPGSPVSRSMVQQIVSEAKAKGAVTIELLGLLVTTDRPIVVRPLGAGKGTTQRVLVDAKVLDASDAKRSKADDTLTLSAECHAIVWRIEGVDGSAEPKLDLSYQTRGKPLAPFYTRAMLEGMSANGKEYELAKGK